MICKCPMCNQPSQQFVKLFLDRPNVSNAEKEKNVGADHSLLLDDDTSTDATYKSLQQKALQFRDKYTTARTNLAKQKEKLQSYQTKIQSLEEEMEQLQQEWEVLHDELTFENAQKQRELERLRLENVQLRREHNTLQRTVEMNQERATHLQTQLHKLQQGYQEAVRKALAQDMTEVKQILADYPKKQEENRKLLERIAILQRETKELRGMAARLVSNKNNNTTTATTHATTTTSQPKVKPRGMLKSLANSTDDPVRQQPPSSSSNTHGDKKSTAPKILRDQLPKRILPLPPSRETRDVFGKEPLSSSSLSSTSSSSRSSSSAGLMMRKRKHDNGPMELLERASPARKPVPKPPAMMNPTIFFQTQKSRVNNNQHESRSIFLQAQKKKRRK
eukprot:scaffold4442_cov125-Amphora_coffeaeformis.AAC.25